ncbi:uncharacterized protein LOC128557864 [Mercenaria mercenaria]|uniref:uncharacterized protein LOC128557864 n=1 Tax=Mercenaria mercenaria TaxID=6596 RepID=UPI00234EB73A|nr:uncharacterized protein LOC128557864 [Mercenaria mercenaria]
MVPDQTMATLDNERYLRHILLLGEGGLLVLRGIVTREATNCGQTLEHTLATNRALFHNLIREQKTKLFPSTSTVNADVQTWDMSLLTVVVKRLFLSGLSSADTSSFETLKSCRNYIQGHPTSITMSATDFTTNRLLLKTALLQLASGISTDTDTEIKDILRRTESGDIDMQLSLRHIKDLHEFKTSLLDELEGKFSVLTDMNRRLSSVETCLNDLDGNHAVRFGALQAQLQGINIATGERKNDMADMKAQLEEISHRVDKMMEMRIIDSERNTKKELQTIIEGKCDQRKKEKVAMCLLFEFVEMIQNILVDDH